MVEPSKSSVVAGPALGRWLALAAAFYAALAIAWSWPLALSANRQVLLPAHLEAGSDHLAITGYDQLLTVAGVARNAASILGAHPAKLLDQGLCYPTPWSGALGEHMIEAGILASPLYALSRDPVLAYNSAVLLSIVIAGLAMLAFVYSWTGSLGAALVAGLLFAFHPSRLGDTAHLAVTATHWIPLVLLLFDRVVDRGRFKDGVLLGLVASLQCVTGAYPLITFVALALPYGALRLFLERRRLDRARVVALASAVAMVTGVLALVLVPYLFWQPLAMSGGGRAQILVWYRDLFPGGRASVGLVVLVLCVLAPLARRGLVRLGTVAAAGPEVSAPALGLVFGSVFCLALSAQGPLWAGGPAVPALLPWLSDHLPMFDSIRAPAAIRMGAYLGLSALAGLALGRLLEALPDLPARMLAALVAAAVLWETFSPGAAARVYAHSNEVVLREVRPDAATLAAYASFDAAGYDGPILDLPHPTVLRGNFEPMARYTYLSAWHLRSTAACYNSFLPPVHFATSRLAARLPDDSAVDEAAAAGLRNLVLHGGDGADDARLIDSLAARGGVRLVYRSGNKAALRIERAVSTQSDPAAIAVNDVRIPPLMLRGPQMVYHWEKTIYLELENKAEVTWVAAGRAGYLTAMLRWQALDGEPDSRGWRENRFFPALALAPGAPQLIPLNISSLPRPGRYLVEIRIPELKWAYSSAVPVTIQ